MQVFVCYFSEEKKEGGGGAVRDTDHMSQLNLTS